MEKNRIYAAIDLKSFYASVEEICEKIRRHYMIVPETLFQELQKKRQSEAS